MGRFASTVAYYESARPPYGAAFFAAVAERLRLDHSERLLDVGAGPGILAIGFKPYCREVMGVDPEPGMVEAARAALARSGVEGVTFIEGRFEDIPGEPARSTLSVSAARSTGSIPGPPERRSIAPSPRREGSWCCRASSVTDGRNPWLEAFNMVRDRWKGDRPARDHHAFFADGRFAPAGTIRVEGTYAISVERLVERVLSMSTSSSERLGDEVPAMRDAMREALAPFAAKGMIEDVVEARAEVFERAGR